MSVKRMKREKYPNEIIVQMRNFYRSLSEKDRRRYAAVEAVKFGYGGITYICEVLECDQSIVSRGIKELKEELPEKESNIRLSGGGRKSVLAVTKGLDEAFLAVLKEHTAGSPTDETVKWTNLSRGEIAVRLKERGFNFSVTVVDQLLEKHNFRPRKAFKVESCKQTIENRDEQFKNIESLKEQYHKEGNPVMSMDVKKKK
jgi:hypothetical protein